MEFKKKSEYGNVYLMDCVEGMKSYPDNHFDLAVVDPPYGIGINQMNMGGRKTVMPDKRIWDKNVPNEQYFLELFRVSKERIIFGGNYFDLPVNRHFIIWDKGESMYGRSFAECEYAWSSLDKSARMIKINPNQLDRFHPTQKPIKLYDWIFKNYAKENDKILDTHLGSGSSRISANKAGLDFTGFEIDEDYFNSQEKRYKNFISQIRLDL